MSQTPAIELFDPSVLEIYIKRNIRAIFHLANPHPPLPPDWETETVAKLYNDSVMLMFVVKTAPAGYKAIVTLGIHNRIVAESKECAKAETAVRDLFDCTAEVLGSKLEDQREKLHVDAKSDPKLRFFTEDFT